jgi:ABC-type antimicrobial peptide transport system permease subunit
MAELGTEVPRQIVGIVGDVRGAALNQDPNPTMYVPNGQIPDALNALNVRLTPLAWIVRSRGNPGQLSAAIQEQLRQTTGLPVSDIRSMEEVISRSTSRQRFNMLLMSVFGVSALILAAIGIYGLMAYSVQQRTQEIGIRLALGAETARVRRMVLWHGFRLALAGVAIGIGAAFGLTRLLAAFLYGVKERDPVVFAAVAVTLTVVSVIAIWFPARRATSIDPVVALRYE